ncbi:hypothetical protein BB558_007217 [Smittium angustum]|uniref:Integrase catalytic domain-containing protein n=1 Tax=Smittium angustum TaxID=133377 RepID=A0A2U1IVK4_SMIAN|nr:hypothetical protein BB558_007217 [Smittium angustum]
MNPILSIKPLEILEIDAVGPINSTSQSGNRGRNLISNKDTRIYQQMRIQHNPTTDYRPQSNRQVKRLNQNLERVLSRLVNSNKKDGTSIYGRQCSL